MDEMVMLQESMTLVLKEMETQKYSKSSITAYRTIYHSIQKFMQENKITLFNEKVCIEFIFDRTKCRVEGFYGYAGSRKVNSFMKPLQVLLDFIQTRSVKFKMRPKIPAFQCPEQFEEEYSTFQEELIYREYARATVINNTEKVNIFLRFLEINKVDSSKLIQTKHLTLFLSEYKNCKPKYISAFIQVLRNYLGFLFDHGFINEDISKSLPKVRITRNAFIPYSWKTKDVKKLLDAVDRGDPKGKRDYAILLLAVRLGLRVSDIRGLRLHSLNWSRKTIFLTMQKTKQPLELPLLEDIGWAIIDYLKNG